MSPALRETLEPLRRQWRSLPPRERRLVGLAGLVVALALAWWIVLSPALATLRSAPAQRQALDVQLQKMLALQAQARAMQSQPRVPRDEAQRALEAAVASQLGSTGRLAIAGDNATLTLSGARADALAQWLVQARINARTVPVEAHLNRNAAGTWDGTLVLALPAR
jgi:general secretion pathway protein M